MKTVTSTSDLRRIVDAARVADRSIGFIPTMGALHTGHTSLFEHARRAGHFVVVSVFVNPLQFGNQDDLDNYPKTFDRDADECRRNGVDVLFAPSVADMYPEGFQTRIVAGRLAERFEGAHRPGHFDGVATVVAKLFNMVRPDVAYFGMKDFQQLAVIKQMIRDLAMPTKVIGCPTIRETDGLAMSSRNARLSPKDRETATVLHRALQLLATNVTNGITLHDSLASASSLLHQCPGVTLDYFEVAHPETLEPVTDDDWSSAVALIAATIGGVRLIDNLVVNRLKDDRRPSDVVP